MSYVSLNVCPLRLLNLIPWLALLHMCMYTPSRGGIHETVHTPKCRLTAEGALGGSRPLWRELPPQDAECVLKSGLTKRALEGSLVRGHWTAHNGGSDLLWKEIGAVRC